MISYTYYATLNLIIIINYLLFILLLDYIYVVMEYY